MRVSVSFEVNLPVGATIEQAEEWVRFCIGANGGIALINPLSNYDMTADFRTVSVNPT